MLTSNYCKNQIRNALKQIYLSGTHGEGRYVKAKLGQPKLVSAITGGGGALFSEFFGLAGASSCLLEAVVPYSKSSCLDWLDRHKQNANNIGFCSEEMAWRLATASRDRALELENDLNRWPDVHGIGCTATIVSHFRRRGDYRVHAAGINAHGQGSIYTHKMVKGARSRQGEDLSCALLAMRAFADSVGVKFNAELGVRTTTTSLDELGGLWKNEIGEISEGTEEIPFCINKSVDPSTTGGSYVLVGSGNDNSKRKVCIPGHALPKNSLIVWCKNKEEESINHALHTAKQGLQMLDCRGDIEKASVGSRTILPTPVFVVIADSDNNKNATNDGTDDGKSDILSNERIHDMAQNMLENVGVMVMRNKTSSSNMQALVSCANAFPNATYVIEYNDDTTLLDDGSPSTIGINGTYIGSVFASETMSSNAPPLPHHHGIMKWDNGITYRGNFCNGLFHGHGSKMYSKGGGYVGSWVMGKREGFGVNLYDGKWGYDKWKGTFVNDKPHGSGMMTKINGTEAIHFEFFNGEPVDL